MYTLVLNEVSPIGAPHEPLANGALRARAAKKIGWRRCENTVLLFVYKALHSNVCAFSASVSHCESITLYNANRVLLNET
jgi:hypothetical protein